MTEKKFFIGATVVLLLVAIPYFLHNSNVKNTKIFLEDREEELLDKFETIGAEVKDLWANTFNDNGKLLSKYYHPELAVKEIDTVLNMVLFKDKLEYTAYDLNYFECLSEVFESEKKLLSKKEKLEKKIKPLYWKYGKKTVEKCIKIVGRSSLYDKSYGSGCDKYDLNSFDATVSEDAIHDLELFVKKYRRNKTKSSSNRYKTEQDYNEQVRMANKGLNSSGIFKLDKKLKESPMLKDSKDNYEFIGDKLGAISYSFPSKKFNDSEFNEILNNLYYDTYKDNKLYNGAQPYSYCYGRNKGCDAYGCSRIDVSAGYGSDVLVTIKNQYGRVVRHGYVRGGSTYKFELPNGSYQTFFYYGKGWNPNKFVKRTNCGVLKGGFVSQESVSKDNKISVYNNVLTYSLTRKTGGNFNTKGSNLSEAL